MKNTQDYLPTNVEFIIDDQDVMPLTLGEFESMEELKSYIYKTRIVALNQALKTNRLMDYYEKDAIRQQYTNILEEELPVRENILVEKQVELEKAKQEYKQAQENFNAYENQAHTLAKEVKRGLVEIELSDVNTFRIPLKNKYYYYTYISGQLKLCAIEDIPEDEKADIFNSGQTNEQIFINGEIETQKGQEKQLLKVAQ